jgi:hypothetical protein
MDAHITLRNDIIPLDDITYSPSNNASNDDVKRLLEGTAKYNPSAFKSGRGVPAVTFTNPDGTLEWTAGDGIPPDGRGFIGNEVKQWERKTALIARLQKKLLQKQMMKK